MNKAMNNNIETIFMSTIPALSAINSTIVRDIIINGGDASQFVPAEIKNKLNELSVKVTYCPAVDGHIVMIEF